MSSKSQSWLKNKTRKKGMKRRREEGMEGGRKRGRMRTSGKEGGWEEERKRIIYLQLSFS